MYQFFSENIMVPSSSQHVMEKFIPLERLDSYANLKKFDTVWNKKKQIKLCLYNITKHIPV